MPTFSYCPMAAFISKRGVGMTLSCAHPPWTQRWILLMKRVLRIDDTAQIAAAESADGLSVIQLTGSSHLL